MARTAITPVKTNRNALATPVFVAADMVNGMVIYPKKSRQVFLYVKNAGAVNPCVVTIAAGDKNVATSAGAALALSVPLSSERIIGPIGSDMFAQGDGAININFDQVTTVTIGAFQVSD